MQRMRAKADQKFRPASTVRNTFATQTARAPPTHSPINTSATVLRDIPRSTPTIAAPSGMKSTQSRPSVSKPNVRARTRTNTLPNNQAAAPLNSHGHRRPRSSTANPSKATSMDRASLATASSSTPSNTMSVLRVSVGIFAQVAKHHETAEEGAAHEED